MAINNDITLLSVHVWLMPTICNILLACDNDNVTNLLYHIGFYSIPDTSRERLIFSLREVCCRWCETNYGQHF
jgi:hypothetical protein